MGAIRANPNLIKLHRSYTAAELAARLRVHKNTIRHWQQDGLKPMDDGRPVLFHGTVVRQFLAERNASRKRPCPPGTLFCLRCRQPRQPALALVEFTATRSGTGRLKAICDCCETVMHRHARAIDLPAIMPGVRVQIVGGRERLGDCAVRPLSCELEGP